VDEIEHKPKEKRTSELLTDIQNSLTENEVTLGEFMTRFGERGFGLGILMFALPNMIPLGIPVISTISAIPIIIFAVQLMFGKQKVSLPKFVANKKFKEKHFEKIIQKTVPTLRKVEKFVRPRASFFTTDLFEKISGLAILVMAGILFLPIPGANFIPAICIGIIALGLLEKDGLMVFAGIAASAVTAYALSFIIYKTLKMFIHWGWGLEQALEHESQSNF
jgi:hypothetical protein